MCLFHKLQHATLYKFSNIKPPVTVNFTFLPQYFQNNFTEDSSNESENLQGMIKKYLCITEMILKS